MRVLITGGAGFIGSNLAEYYLSKKDEVTVWDNFSRRGSAQNVRWLKTLEGKLKITTGEIRTDLSLLRKEVEKNGVVFHLAAQVAVTTSVNNPREDFEINALGTFNVLEAVRLSKNKPVLLYSSTNKVYGEMKETPVKETKTKYEFVNLKKGVSEEQLLDFHSPYGCSKGVAEQYVRDYARIYGLKTLVFRQSCIYGPRQFGVEDQGWVAWFIIALTLGKKITVYGNGKQVRDLLFISDLVRAYDLAIKNINRTSGQIYNIGGGQKNAISIWWELGPILENLFQKKINPKFSAWRPGDQPIFVANCAKAKRDFGWEPRIGVKEGITKLYNWVQKNQTLFT